MSEDQVNIEINGIPLKAKPGVMLIDVADANGIQIPRFCYHKKLSVAANCRMCLVEVERAPKPMPACATPVAEGMKVYTQSPRAISAQQGTMEFLLINQPLDCPICDQGGECELQDIAMGYGEDVSRYTEQKRVVKDKNIGPLIATDMTRCIHCTRCVRFGEEIAGLRELGATGRGEHMEIGTYVEKSVSSELSGNVIDLCPVGALTAKPSRYRARAWELLQHASVAPHDAIGSNLYLHTFQGKVVRAVPRDNEAINECWISDRDRFSYEGINSGERLQRPMLKQGGKWQEVDWEVALEAVVKGLKDIESEDIGALLSPNATLEELYLAQKWLRGLGVANIDHRLRQIDFSDQAAAPLFPWLGMALEDLDHLDAALLVGSNIRKDQPIAGHRLRKAAMNGAAVMAVNPRDFGFNFRMAEQCIDSPSAMVDRLAGIARAVLEAAGATAPAAVADLVGKGSAGAAEKAIAGRLKDAEKGVVLLGTIALQHPAAAALRALAAVIAEHTGLTLGFLPDAANAAGGWLAGALPHRGVAGAALEQPGLDARAMLAQPRKAYVLLGVEPELDCANPAMAMAAMQAAGFVVGLTPFVTERMKQYADVLLPIATFAETAGTFVNAEGRWQSFNGVTNPPGEARPGWKVLRVLANLSGVNGFDYMAAEEAREELKAAFAGVEFDNRLALDTPVKTPVAVSGLQRIGAVPIYAVDGLVRRAASLQATADGQDRAARLNGAEAREHGLLDAERVRVRQGDASAALDLVIDDGIPAGCVWVPAGVAETIELADAFGAVEIEKL
ncbi:MAG: NADH-quinone oxidoreductase subunit G [Chromatiales bacterium]|nr:NADH-quinone oxidoreductase subunit G [Chromatiales bacterium]